MDAPGVRLEAPETGEHQDSEEQRQHGDAQRRVCDQGQRLQVALQLLLTERCKGGGWKEEEGENLLKKETSIQEDESLQLHSNATSLSELSCLPSVWTDNIYMTTKYAIYRKKSNER